MAGYGMRSCAGHKLTIVSLESQTPAQQRFVAAYKSCLKIKTAARVAGVGRSTAYRWLQANPSLNDALLLAYREAVAEWQPVLAAQEAERKRWREERERARHPMRCANLARARAIKQRKQVERVLAALEKLSDDRLPA